MATQKEKRSILITGCSDGGLGAALAVAFHEAGYHVYATARNVDKMKQLTAQGIETLELDVQSESSIKECLGKIPRLDILLNNAGTMLTMPVVDTSIEKAKELFETNVWGPLRMIQAFVPLLLESKGMIVNNTSIGAFLAAPFGGAYSASKAALAMFTETLRIEMEAFDIKVVDMRTGTVGPTNLLKNNTSLQGSRSDPILPKGSIYEPARELVESVIRRDGFKRTGMNPALWAKEVVQDLSKSKPPAVIWRGQSAATAWYASMLPHGFLDGFIKKLTQYSKIEEIIRAARN
ncbi:NAD(P)-binding protein [Trichoderma citrinoviride]|uniref:NAD(P)-binding protein n=1 Tax=Trichoderma citrinoviride TaxID=58853 RepID=A0A2T4BC00_9HYPO|nr:NAD(P)-binding protein [Trichoderma citrinoviride]PTB66761.1 NAD(P)-binding protein [Trichoderma citrinoviride]